MTQLTVRKCALSEVVDAPNFLDLAHEYADECAMSGMPSPVAKLPLYRQLEDAGALTSFGAWEGSTLIGFLGVLFSVVPHYSTGLAVSESFFVAKAHRSTGAGMKLKALAEDHAGEIGSPGLMLSAPWGSQFAAVLFGSEYKPVSLAFFKEFT